MNDDRSDPELGARLRAYESRLPATDAPVPGTAPARFPRWPIIGLGAAAVLVAVVIGSELLDSQPIGEVSPTASATAAPASATAPSPSASAAPSLSQAPEPTAVPASAVPTATATASPDAAAAELEIVMREGTDDTLQYVVGFGHGTEGRVAAVNVRDGAEIVATGPWLGSGAIYRETDDGSWERVDTGDMFKDVGFTTLLSPLRGPMVLYGFPADAQPPRETTGVWTSTDGRTWTEVDVVRGSVFAVGPLGYVQASVEPTQLDGSVIELYWSDDALNWELVHSVAAGRDAQVWAAGGGPEGFVVAARMDGERAPLMLASGDGRTWFQAPKQAALADDDVVMTVAPIGPDWVAAGWRSISGPARGIDVWSSADGLHWEAADSILPDDDEEAFGSRVMYPSHLIALGDTLFLSTAFAVEGSDTRPRSVWTSTDGRIWEEIDLGGPAEVRAVDGIECCFWMGGRIGSSDGEAVIWRWDPGAR